MSRKTEGGKPKIAVIGFTGAGKTTVARIFAELTGGKAIDTSDVIMHHYATTSGIPLAQVKAEKHALRKKLYAHAASLKSRDPAFWGKRAMRRGANVVAGFRDPYEFEAARCLFDHVVWVHRPGWHPGETDHLDSGYGEVVVCNDGTGDEWWGRVAEQCHSLLDKWELEVVA